jgi:hypothetical protein
MADAGYVKQHYPRGKADLYAAFLERGLQLTRHGGTSALLTMRNWMFIKQYSELRCWLLETYDLRALGDFDRGAFEEVLDEVVSVVVSVFRRIGPAEEKSVALQPTPLDDRKRDNERTRRKRAAVLCGVGRHEFGPAVLKVVPEWPVVYWWSSGEREAYRKARLLGDVSPAKFGINTGNNVRFLRLNWEISPSAVSSIALGDTSDPPNDPWQRYLKGAAGMVWLDPCDEVGRWLDNGLEMKVYAELLYGSYSRQIRNESVYYLPGVAFTMLGAGFSARAHRWRCLIDSKGSSVYPESVGFTLCQMNRTRARGVLRDFNPTLSFQVGDVNRLPLFDVEQSDQIYSRIESLFSEHESHREPSVEFRRPGPSPWRHAQEWAQAAVDRPDGTPLPPYQPELDPEPPTDHVSFSLGVALGRFGADGEGILDPTTSDLSHSLSAGICFLDGTLDAHDHRDSLGHAASHLLHETWATKGPDIDSSSDLRTYLRLRFFDEVHRKMCESRPIHWPLSSEKKTFVAWINIHRWNADTLRVLLADQLHPALARLDGEIDDLRTARDGADKKAARAAEKRFDSVKKWRDELAAFIGAVEQCAEKGPPPTDSKCPARAVDARYDPDLDDGVMINSAALWPLLEPQWKEPKKWWKELASSQGKKDYDWSHLAMRYWPDRVDQKCQGDPSLGVAHGCFWRYHPARAWAWELRLEDEIGPDFRIDEAPYRGDGGSGVHRAAYLEAQHEDALQAVEKEALRRRRKHKAPQAELRLLETGLWSTVPEQCWDLELRIIEKQGADFHLRAPDEQAARATFEVERPERVKARRLMLASLEPAGELFDNDAEPAESDTDPNDELSNDGLEDENEDQA